MICGFPMGSDFQSDRPLTMRTAIGSAKDVDRLALLVVNEPQPVNGLDHFCFPALLDDGLHSGSGHTDGLAGWVVQRRYSSKHWS
jgi:hypothetical protein